VRWLGGGSTASAIPTPQSLLRSVYVGRVCVAVAIYLSAALKFNVAGPFDILVSSLLVVAMLVVNVASYWHTHVRGRSPSLTFLYAQALFDVALVTTVVHITGGPQSDFTPLYVPLIAVNAVLMPPTSTALVTLLVGIVYFADVFFGHSTTMTPDIAIQLALFASVATVTAYFASRVSVMGAEREALAGELRQVRLEAADVLRNIPTGVVTVDADGRLLYCNPAAEQILGFRERECTDCPRVLGGRDRDGAPRRARDAGGSHGTEARPNVSHRGDHHDARDRPGRDTPGHGDLHRHLGLEALGGAALAGRAPGGGGGALVELGARDQESARLHPLVGRAARPDQARQPGRQVPRGTDRAGERPPVAAAVGVPRFLARSRD